MDIFIVFIFHNSTILMLSFVEGDFI